MGHLGKATTDYYLTDFFAAVEAFLQIKGIEVNTETVLAGAAKVATTIVG